MTTIPDPRPEVRTADERPLLVGGRCTSCRHPTLWASPVCSLCGGRTAAAEFGPWGTVWSSTVVRVPVPDRKPPYVLAYVDLDDGPRVLAHVSDPAELAQRVAVGTRVVLTESTVQGDVQVEVPA
ncbi:MAG: hypothetical protein RI958_249 [Actinomycetota bacterium]|jgi:uncharacterized OB-fold protein